MREICVITSGRAELMVQGQVFLIDEGTLLIIEPGEVHAWSGKTRDCRMLVLHEPWDADDLQVVAAV